MKENSNRQRKKEKMKKECGVPIDYLHIVKIDGLWLEHLEKTGCDLMFPLRFVKFFQARVATLLPSYIFETGCAFLRTENSVEKV